MSRTAPGDAGSGSLPVMPRDVGHQFREVSKSWPALVGIRNPSWPLMGPSVRWPSHRGRTLARVTLYGFAFSRDGLYSELTVRRLG